MKILAISGSLRAASINSAFCRATARLAPSGVRVEVLSVLGDIPAFNQDLEAAAPQVVQALRTAVGECDAMLIASPEYAHGVSGVLKNALDWLVSYEGTVRKPIALVNTSPRAHRAYDALRETLATMSTDIVVAASMTLPLLGVCTTEEQMMKSPHVSRSIREIIDALVQHLRGQRLPSATFPIS
jgi:chromate reductase